MNNPFNIHIISHGPQDATITNNRDIDIDALSSNEQYKQRFEQDTKHRSVLVWWMMGVVGVWLLLVLLLMAVNKPWCLFIDNNVLITLLATTTLNVLGLARIILGGLFNNKQYK